MQLDHSFTLQCLKLEWDPAMHNVGHPTIDEQHQELVRIGNVLIDLVQQEPQESQGSQELQAGREPFLEQFGLFHQLLVRHLKFEESLLATAVSETALEAHNKGHRKFEQFVQSIIDGYACRSGPEQCIIEIMQFTNHHIFIDDFKLVDEFRALAAKGGKRVA